MQKRHKLIIEILIIYTLLSLALLSVLECFFFKYNKGFGWEIDYLPVQLPLFNYLHDFIVRFKDWISGVGDSNLFYDFRVGLGGDSFTFLAMWYLEPLSFLGIFSNVSNIDFVYDCLVLIRIYLIGASYIALCIYDKKDNPWAVTWGALVYSFSGYVMYYIRHPVFFAGLIYLPLLIIGTKEVIKGKEGLFFVAMVALSSWTSYYFLYINTIILLFYTVIELSFSVQKLKQFMVAIYRLGWRYLLGIAMSGVVLVPNLITFFNSNRTTPHLETGSYWMYEKGWGSRLLSGLCAPFISPGHWLHNGFIAFGIISVILLFIEVKDRKMMIYTMLMLLGLLIPIVTYIFSGFSAIQFRWNYVVGLLCAYSCTEYWNDKQYIDKKKAAGALLSLFVYLAIPLFYEELNNQYVFEASVFLFLYVMIVDLFYKKYVSTFFYMLITVVIVANILLDMNYTYGDSHGDYIAEFVEKNKSVEMIIDEPEAASDIIDDTDFYRIDSARLKVQNENSALFLDNNGISNYVNVMDKNYANYYYGLENPNTRLLDTLDNDSRTVLEELESVKYFFVYPGEKSYVPYGYEYFTTHKGVDIYKNKFALPLGYSYSKYILKSEYDKLSALDKQEVLMKAVVVDDKKNLDHFSYNSSISIDDIEIDFNGCEYDEKTRKCRVTEPGGYLTIKYNIVHNSETYLRLDNLNIDDYYNVYWKIRIYNDDIDKWVELRSSTATYSYGNYSYLVNLGYNASSNEVNVAFPFVSEFSLDDIEIMHFPMDKYNEDYAEICSDTLEKINIREDSVEGEFVASKKEMCVLSIPYSKGWKAYVDGEKCEIVKANIAFMGLMLEPGNHHIVLKYFTPGLKEGIIISFVAFMLFGLVIVFKAKK